MDFLGAFISSFMTRKRKELLNDIRMPMMSTVNKRINVSPLLRSFCKIRNLLLSCWSCFSLRAGDALRATFSASSMHLFASLVDAFSLLVYLNATKVEGRRGNMSGGMSRYTAPYA